MVLVTQNLINSNKKFSSEEEASQYFSDKLISFSFFIDNEFRKRKLKEMPPIL